MSNILTYELFEFNLFKKKDFYLKNLKTNIEIETHTIEEYENLMKILDIADYKWINSDTPIYKHKKDWDQWFKWGYRFILIMPNSKKIGHMTGSKNPIQLKDLMSDEYMKNMEKEIEKQRMKHVDVDPLGEEDWMNESLSNFRITFTIECENINEYNAVLSMLDEEGGYTWLGGMEKPLEYNAFKKGYKYLIIIPSGKKIGHSTHIRGYENILALDILPYKYRKRIEEEEKLRKEKNIRMRDVDPYEEEDWID